MAGQLPKLRTRVRFPSPALEKIASSSYVSDMVVSIVFCPFWCDTVSALAETPGVRALVRAAFGGRMAGAMSNRAVGNARPRSVSGDVPVIGARYAQRCTRTEQPKCCGDCVDLAPDSSVRRPALVLPDLLDFNDDMINLHPIEKCLRQSKACITYAFDILGK